MSTLVTYDVQRSRPATVRALAEQMHWLSKVPPSYRITAIFSFLSENLDRDLIVLIDDMEWLSEYALKALLIQLRIGFNASYDGLCRFPKSIALTGRIDVSLRPTGEQINGHYSVTSDFPTESLRLSDCSLEDIHRLYRQHTCYTGQAFADDAAERSWYWSEGQPWLANAFAAKVTRQILKDDPLQTIDGNHIDQAATMLLSRNDDRFRSFSDRLQLPGYLRVIDAVIAGSNTRPSAVFEEHVQNCLDIALLKVGRYWNSGIRPAHPYCRDVILKTLEYRLYLPRDSVRLLTGFRRGNTLDMSGILSMFQDFWIENASEIESRSFVHVHKRSEITVTKTYLDFPDKKPTPDMYFSESGVVKLTHLLNESFCLLVLTAFLRKLVDMGAEIVGDFAMGSESAIITLSYGQTSYPIVCTIKGRLPKEESIRRLRKHIVRCDSPEGWIVLFDRDPEKTRKDKSSWEIDSDGWNTAFIVGC
ncbi:MAG: hypothetical protein LBR80_10415 [Deltaproteobacteria bacterium]|jgi:hypothetical protein|nr:hypothetical protein [Deltaproteobacteria bacterium]